MRILILGSGVVGVCSAYYLARAGHEVTVVERLSGAGMETSYANAGQVSPGYAGPWAAPGIPLKALKWLFQRHAPLAIRPDGSLFQLRWLARMLRNCSAARHALNKERMVRLAEYSRDCLRVLRAETGIAYEGRQQGTLQVFREPAQLRAAQRDIRVLLESGVPFELLPPERLWEAEPALDAVRHKLAGGLWLPGDETGDCYLFTVQLARLAREGGVRFRFGVEIEALAWEAGALAGVRCRDGLLTADAYVMALGSWSRRLLLPVLDLPVYPVKGYSITLPLVEEAAAPSSTVIDETYKIAVTRFERRIRVGGMAEVAGFDKRLDPRRRATLQMVAGDLFPGAGDAAQAGFWTGLRPMTPDGTPLVGATPLPNLFLNTGHGTLGWTMCCGSGQLLADLICGQSPAIQADDLSLARYARPQAGRTRAVYAEG